MIECDELRCISSARTLHIPHPADAFRPDGYEERCESMASHVRLWPRIAGAALCEKHADEWIALHPSVDGRIEPLCLFLVGDEGWIALECALFTLAGAR